MNTPMQGTAADIIKRAMLGVDAWLAASGRGTRLIMQVHDELVFELPQRELRRGTGRLRRIMESAAELSVPLESTSASATNWDEAH